MPAHPEVAVIIARLEAVYGPQVWTQRRDPLEELVVTCLAQHTSDLNADRAFASLWARFGGWAAIDAAPLDEVPAVWRGRPDRRTQTPRM